MNEASIMATFLVVFRECLEAGLILGIILTLVVRMRAHRYVSHVLGSAGLAVICSIFAGIGLSALTASAQGQAEKIIEGVISLVAAGILTYMVFWMDRQSRRIKSEIEVQVETALSRGDYLAMVSLPFVAVLREGAETVLFLKAISLQSGAVSLWGGLSGFGLALGITVLIFAVGRRVPLRPLFRGTGILILLIAAGLLAYGIHELEEAGWIPQVLYPLYDINAFLNEKEGIGSFLKALFGYNGNPSLPEFIAYWAYLLFVAGFIFRKQRQPVSSGRTEETKP